MPITLLVADAQRLVGQALTEVLDRFPDFEAHSHAPISGQEAIYAAAHFRPDVAIIDYWLSDMEGPAVVRTIMREVPHCRVLILSWFHGPEQIHNSLAAGAAGFLPKSVTTEELADAVRLAHAGETPVLAERLDKLVKTLADRQQSVEQVSARLSQLTRKEMSVLNALKYGAPLDKVAGDLFISLPTLKSHIRSILRKTGARSSSEAVAMGLHCGMIQV